MIQDYGYSPDAGYGDTRIPQSVNDVEEMAAKFGKRVIEPGNIATYLLKLLGTS